MIHIWDWSNVVIIGMQSQEIPSACKAHCATEDPSMFPRDYGPHLLAGQIAWHPWNWMYKPNNVACTSKYNSITREGCNDLFWLQYDWKNATVVSALVGKEVGWFTQFWFMSTGRYDDWSRRVYHRKPELAFHPRLGVKTRHRSTLCTHQLIWLFCYVRVQ